MSCFDELIEILCGIRHQVIACHSYSLPGLLLLVTFITVSYLLASTDWFAVSNIRILVVLSKRQVLCNLWQWKMPKEPGLLVL
jgi:hypothetical protein